MSEYPEVKLRPIGRVVRRHGEGKEAVSEIEIDVAWVEALDGIEGFSHVWILWWLDRFADPPAAPRVRPEGRPEMPLVGIFATRSPLRPCPIAMTAVRLLECRGARLRVAGFDAYEGTYILDIKPYLRRGDRVAEPAAPRWLEELWRIHDEEKRQG